MQEQELLKLLQAYSIPLDKWGVGEAKTFNHLLLEVQSGEATVIEENGKLLRLAKGAVVTVYYTDNNKKVWRLKEDKQIFKDGRERRRDLGTSVSEKLQSTELAVDAAYRALKEELSITERLTLISKPTITKGPVSSQSYPGFMTRYVMNAYEVFLPEHLYKSDGYVEQQRDKDSYFVWV